MEDYLSNAVRSVGGFIVLLCCFFITTDGLTEEEIEYVSRIPSIMQSSALIIRLNNDLVPSSVISLTVCILRLASVVVVHWHVCCSCSDKTGPRRSTQLGAVLYEPDGSLRKRGKGARRKPRAWNMEGNEWRFVKWQVPTRCSTLRESLPESCTRFSLDLPVWGWPWSSKPGIQSAYDLYPGPTSSNWLNMSIGSRAPKS